jgi:putative transposase
LVRTRCTHTQCVHDMSMEEPRGWYSRGYLPHIDVGAHPQFLTWRLADSLPHQVLAAWHAELEGCSDAQRNKQLMQNIEAFCDGGHGSCVLARPGIGSIVQETLLYDHDRKYLLHNWAVMPNHVHALLTPLPGITLESILKVVKSVSATRINKVLGQSGQLWQKGFFDRYISDEDHFHRVAKYIEWNRVKAKLCTDPKHWPLSSANYVARRNLETD